MNITIRDAGRLRGILLRITPSGDVEIAADDITGPEQASEPAPPAPPDPLPVAVAATSPIAPPDGVCVLRSVEALTSGKDGLDIQCPLHGVAAGKPCPEQSPEPDLGPAPVENAPAPALAVGQFRADTTNPGVAAVEVMAQDPARPDPWDIRVLVNGARAWFTDSDVSIFWPTIAPKPDGDAPAVSPHAPQYYAVGQRWNDTGSDSHESASHMIEIVEHDNGRDPDVWKVQPVPPSGIPDSWCSSEQIRQRWPGFVGWATSADVPALIAPDPASDDAGLLEFEAAQESRDAAQKSDADELPRAT